MIRISVGIAAVGLLVVNGAVHGILSQRWKALSEPAVLAACERLRNLPLKINQWDGRPVEADQAHFSEDVIGRNITVRYVNRVTGATFTVYVACWHTESLMAHTPLDCYPANGFTTTSECKVVLPPSDRSSKPSEFSVATFARDQSAVPIYLRVFWGWNDSRGWQVPTNGRRTFRGAPYVYKVYVIRQMIGPDEPVDGDPAESFLAEILPELSRALSEGAV